MYGVAEDCEDNFSLATTRDSLLSGFHNPRRALLRQVALSSDHKRCADFIMSSGADFMCSKFLTGGADLHVMSTITEFVVYGKVETEEGQLGTSSVRHSLLDSSGHHNPRRALLKDVLLSSNNTKCTSFVTRSEKGILCSKDLESADLVWAERVLAVKPGTLFKAARTARSGPPSTTELPWEPMERYKAFARQRQMRKRRGSKSVSHLESLRMSDPTSSLSGWIDSRKLTESVKASPLAILQQQAQMDWALHDHVVRIRQQTGGASYQKGFNIHVDVDSPDNAKSRSHAEPIRTVHEERTSAESVMSFLDDIHSPKSPSSILDSAPGKNGLDGSWSLGTTAGKFIAGAKGILEQETVWFEGTSYVQGSGYSFS